MSFPFDELKAKVQNLYQTGADTARKVSASAMEKGSTLAQTGLDKAQQVGAIAKLKTASLAEEETLRRAYQELGRLYFEKYGAAPEVEFLSVCAAIDESLAKLEINRAKLDELAASLSGVAPVVVVPEAPAPEEPSEAETGSADPLADLDAFIEKANAEADRDSNANS